MMYLHIGFVIALLVGVPWFLLLSQMVIEALRGYIKDDVWVKPKLFFALYPKEPNHCTWGYANLRAKDIEKEHVMNGNMIWAFWALGNLLFVPGLILLWPIMIVILTLKGLRMYNTNEHFAKLFERTPKAPKPAKVLKEKVIRGLE